MELDLEGEQCNLSPTSEPSVPLRQPRQFEDRAGHSGIATWTK